LKFKSERSGGEGCRINMKLIQTATFGVPEFEMKPQANYRPRISAEHLSHLRLLKRRTKKPITRIIAEALDFYFDDQNGISEK
jgi:hypothetical protein